jgi:hypothetical protein
MQLIENNLSFIYCSSSVDKVPILFTGYFIAGTVSNKANKKL